MNEHDSQRQELSQRDIELSRQLAATLERSTDEIDALTRARLAAARRAALTHSRRRLALRGLALAAGLAAVAATPWMLQRHAQPADTAYLSADPDMLADMDMLLALGESE